MFFSLYPLILGFLLRESSGAVPSQADGTGERVFPAVNFLS